MTKQLPKVNDVVIGEAPFAYVNEADYHWLRYPRSGFTQFAIACFSLALGFGFNILARKITAAFSNTRDGIAQWEYVAFGIALLCALIFWLIGLKMSTHTRRVLNRLRAVFEPDKVKR
jgi:hypothetical protein